MAKRGISVGVEISGDARSFKRAAEDAAKATAELKRQASAHAKETKQSFEQTTIALAKIGGAAMIAKEGFELYSKVMNSTEGTAEKLEKQISFLEGSMSGLMRTIAVGSWESLISNMTKTAEATRDAREAMQEFEHASAGRTITRGELNIGLQEARVSAGEATNPKDKAKYLSEAVSYQKQLTALNVSEISERLKIDEDYYKTLTGHSKEYFDYFLKMVPTLAENYSHYFGKDAVAMEGIKGRLVDLDYLKSLGPLTEAQEKERHQLSLLKFVMEDYVIIQDDMSKKGQWDNYIKGIGEMKDAAAQGEKALVKLVKQLTAAQQASKPLVRQKGPKEATNIFEPSNKDFTNSLNGIPLDDKLRHIGMQINDEWTYSTEAMKKHFETLRAGIKSEERMTDALVDQKKVAGDLYDAFDSMFSRADEGWKSMADDAIASLKRIAKEILKSVLTKIILNAITSGAGAAASAGASAVSAGTSVAFAAFADGTNFAPGGLSLVGERGPELLNLPRGSQVTPNNALTQKIEVFGKLRGHDIYFSNARFTENRNHNT